MAVLGATSVVALAALLLVLVPFRRTPTVPKAPLPSGWPPRFPMPNGMTGAVDRHENTDGLASYVLTLHTSMAPDDAEHAFDAALRASGWTTFDASLNGDDDRLSFIGPKMNGVADRGQIHIVNGDGTTTVGVSLGLLTK